MRAATLPSGSCPPTRSASTALRSNNSHRCCGSSSHFVDPSLAVAAPRATPARLTTDLEFLGLLFESVVVRDLRVLAQAADAQVFRYREKDGLEVDAVVEAADGRWAAFEIKLGERWVDHGAKSLRRLARRLEQSDHDKPSALAVIVPTGCGQVKPGELGVIPIGALGPLCVRVIALRHVHQCTRVLLSDQEECASRTGRSAPTLLPFLQGAYGHTQQFRKPRLRQPRLLANARDGGHVDDAAVLTTLELADAFQNLFADVPAGLNHPSLPEGTRAPAW